jgi:uncharacterized protein YcbK (DUF882 family)
MVLMIDRRSLFLGAVAAAGWRTVPAWAEAGTSANDWLPPKWRELGFPTRRWVTASLVHTGEKFKNIYMEDGKYIMPAVKEFSWVCRDYRRNEWRWIEPRLMDLLFILHWKYDRDEVKILSGYRAPDTNTGIEGAALHSQHTVGKALDVHLRDIDNTAVARDFKKFIEGGVGMYPMKNFTHLDWGPQRSWSG